MWRWLIGIAIVLASSPASAAFHLMKVVEVFPGTATAPNAQYVVLQMYSGGQNLVATHKVHVFDAAGTLIQSFTFPAAVPIGTSQSKILIATTEAQSFFGVTADLAMTAVLPAGGGKVCFDTLDCVAWGTYSRAGGDTAVGTPFNSPAVPVAGQPNRGLVSGKAIRRRLDLVTPTTTLQAGDDTNNSSNDFVFDAPAPRNNAGATGAPPSSTCGNGALEGLESCDDNNATSGDGCSAACVDELCGDLVVNDTTETCDDGNATSGDGCDANCTVTACGNGIITAGETCDDTNVASGDGCDANCTPTGCGNSVVTSGESCDDGNLTSGDGCDANCTPTACGNGIVTAGEACEPPAQGACNASCQLGCSSAAECVDSDPCTANERCELTACVVDSTPTDDAEPCTVDSCGAGGVIHDPLADGSSCVLAADPATRALCLGGACGVARCGDAFVDVNAPGGPEQCDDGNAIDDDGCTNACTTPRCGDAILQSGEECDDGGIAPNDGCGASCANERCGDGVEQAGEECDDGSTQPNDGCSPACLTERCGDGVIQADEPCDDGNEVAGDGCDACVAERCGDGVVQGDEVCDDGNTTPGDGCSDACTGETVGPGGCCGTSSGGGEALLALLVLGLLARRRFE